MKFYLVAVGTKMPSWVEAGYLEYAKRLPSPYSLQLIEVPSLFRGKTLDVSRTLRDEGHKVIQAVPKRSIVVTLEPEGRQFSTEELAHQLEAWTLSGDDVSFLIGGPEGLAPECKEASVLAWSLSKLVMPHPLVRVVVAEALYRAWSVLHHHPYHRA